MKYLDEICALSHMACKFLPYQMITEK